MRGWAGKKKSKKKSIGKVNCQKKSKMRILALADYWRQQTVKKKSKKVNSGKNQKKVEKKKSKNKSKNNKKNQKQVKCENQARILALADYWRQQKVKKKSKKSRKKVNSARDSGAGQGWVLGTLGWATRDRAGLGLKRPWDSGWGWVGVLRLWGRGSGLAWGWKR